MSKKSVRAYWKEIILDINTNGKLVDDRRTRECYELLNQTYILSPKHYDSIKEPVQFLSQFSDWIYPDIDEIKQVILEKSQSPHYEYSYANRVFSYNNSINQVRGYIIPLLEKTPYTRRAIIGFINPTTDDADDASEKPGIISLQFLYRQKRLHLTAHIRSCDMFFGFPANIIQLHTLLNYVCEQTNMPIGDICVFCSSAHIFSDQKPYINKLLDDK